MTPESTVIPADRLEAMCVEALMRAGASNGEAEIVGRSLIDASLRGIDSHGVELLTYYLPRIAAQGWASPSRARITSEHGATALMDGGNGLGAVTALKGMEHAIGLARNEGVGLVSVRNSSHFGAAGYFARAALAVDMIGIVLTNASPAMAPTGGRERLISNNPWAVAIPSNESFDITLDLANSVVARGRIRQAVLDGRQIPVGWAQDINGDDTSDPAAALLGALLPMAGHKGYGISLMVDILSGALSSGSVGTEVLPPFNVDAASTHGQSASFTPQGVGHMLLVVDVRAFRPLDEFKHVVSALVSTLRNSRPRPGVDRVRAPGEIESDTAIERGRDGVPVRAETLAEIEQWCAGEIGA